MGNQEEQRKGAAAANGRAAEKLQEALSRLQNDIQKVEVWAGALTGFTQPIPPYEPHCDRYALAPQAEEGTDARSVRREDADADVPFMAPPVGVIAR